MFLCKWDSWEDQEYYSKRIWPACTVYIVHHHLNPGSHNVLYIKISVMKNIIKALDQNGSTKLFLRRKFPKISEAKITAWILNGPQIRELIKDNNFENSMNVHIVTTLNVVKIM